MDRIPQLGSIPTDLYGLLSRTPLSSLLPKQQLPTIMQQSVQKFISEEEKLKDKSKNRSIEDQLLSLDLLAYHESNGSMSPTQRQILTGGESGRAIGAFQWEPQRVRDSVLRAKKLIAKAGAKTPRWLEILDKNIDGLSYRKPKDADKIRNSIAQLSYDQQRDLALADLTMDKKTSLRLVNPRNADEVANLWSKGWHRGDSDLENFKEKWTLWKTSGETFPNYGFNNRMKLRKNLPQRKPQVR
tara:strand:+ start:806 stop:1534 length:729 start_codon:yes stop_codon:yes gene_type:complete